MKRKGEKGYVTVDSKNFLNVFLLSIIKNLFLELMRKENTNNSEIVIHYRKGIFQKLINNDKNKTKTKLIVRDNAPFRPIIKLWNL